MFKTDADIKMIRLNKKLRRVENGIAIAAADTLDVLGFRSKIQSEREFAKDHIIRTKFIQRGMLFEKTKRNVPIAQMEVRSGNIRDFASLLEVGGTVGANKKYIEVPTDKSRTSGSKKKVVQRKKRLDMMPKARRLPAVSGGTMRRFAAMLDMARRDAYYGPFLITKEEGLGLPVPIGVFHLVGYGRRRPRGGKIVKLRTLERKVRIKGHSFVEKAGMIVGRNMDQMYILHAEMILGKMGGRI